MSIKLNICQTVEGISVILQFDEFLYLILGGFLTFGPGSEDLQQSYSSLNSKKNVVRSILNCHGKTGLSNGTLTLRMPFKLTSPSAAVCNEIESQTVHHNMEKSSRNIHLG